MNVLVIGGSGFIGTRLVDELIEAGNQVKIFDLNISEKYPELTITGDVRSAEQLQVVARGVDIIYNLAAEHRDDVTPVTLYHEVNVTGAQNVIIAAVANNIKHIIFTSTVAIYGLDKHCPDETFPAEPFNEYGRTKWEAEKLLQKWAKGDQARNLVIIRPAVVFGEGNRGNVYNLITQIKSGRFIMIGKGNNHKSMGYVGNLALFLSQTTNKKGIHIFNFCDKPDLSSKEIVSVIASGLNIKLPSIKLPLWFGLLLGNLLDVTATLTGRKFPISTIRIRKFAAETTVSTDRLLQSGYQPKYTLAEGIVYMINHDFNNQLQENKK